MVNIIYSYPYKCGCGYCELLYSLLMHYNYHSGLKRQVYVYICLYVCVIFTYWFVCISIGTWNIPSFNLKMKIWLSLISNNTKMDNLYAFHGNIMENQPDSSSITKNIIWLNWTRFWHNINIRLKLKSVTATDQASSIRMDMCSVLIREVWSAAAVDWNDIF